MASSPPPAAEPARALAEDVSERITFQAVGSHQLRDMPGPEELVELMAPGLTAGRGLAVERLVSLGLVDA